MNGVNIRKQIDHNNTLIQEVLTPNFFTLNNTVANLLEENRALQARCEHQYEEGYCIYCDKSEE